MRRRGRAWEGWENGCWFRVVLCGKLAKKVLSEAKVTNLSLAYFELSYLSLNKGGKIGRQLLVRGSRIASCNEKKKNTMSF